MEHLSQVKELHLTEENKLFIAQRARKYSTYSDSQLDNKILNSYCVLLACLQAKRSS